MPSWNAVPFFETAAAARGGGVLGNEDRMAAHGRLPPVVLRLGLREPLAQELSAVLQHDWQGLFSQIRLIFRPQLKSAAKAASCQGREEVVEISHGKIGCENGPPCIGDLSKHPNRQEGLKAISNSTGRLPQSGGGLSLKTVFF